MYEVKKTNDFIDFVDSFNITVAEIEKFFPNRTHQLNDLFYDFQSYTLALQSE